MIHDVSNFLNDHELVIVRDYLNLSKHTCSYIRNEHSHRFITPCIMQ